MKQYIKAFLKHPQVIRFASWIIALYIRFIYKTSSWQKIGWEHPQSYWDAKKPFIVYFWHNRLLMTCFAWGSENPFHMLISAHPDGQLISQVVGHYDIKTVVGSKSKGGTAALRAMLSILKAGGTIGITPDGPRGPRFKMSEGLLTVAKLSRLDILPVTYAVSRRRVLSSWDRFVLALPFSKGVLLWGKPIPYSQWSQESDIKKVQEHLEQNLTKLCDLADTIVGAPIVR